MKVVESCNLFIYQTIRKGLSFTLKSIKYALKLF